jgi:hypothetical protein
MTTYNMDTRNTSRHEIEEEIVSGAYGNTSIQEQIDLYDGDVSAAAQAVADFYEGEQVEFVNFDDSPLDVAGYAASYIERNK